MKVLVSGDYCADGRVSESIRKGDYESLFSSIKSVVKEYDFSIVNFEFPIVLSEGDEIKKIGPCLKGQKESVETLNFAGFNVCTLANNHILDQGERCCMDTIRLLHEAGIETVGAGGNIKDAGKTLYMKKNGDTLAIINCCEHEFTIATAKRAGANPLNVIQQYYRIEEARKKADYVLVIVHGGHEYFQLPSPRMQETYRYFLDVGADVVVNHHQHCFSGYEEYHGKYIFYGLGNLLFDDENRRNGSWTEGYMLGLDFEGVGQMAFQLYPYIQCGEDASVRLIDGSDCKSFMAKLSRLNNIIAHEKLLALEYSAWLKDNSVFLPMLFEPWQGKLTSALYRHGILPTTFDEERRLKLINSIWCESHLDKLRSVYNDYED